MAELREHAVYAALESSLEEIALEIERDVVDYLEREGHQVSGDLKKRVTHQIVRTANEIKASIGPHIYYAQYLHEGTKPHWVPISAIKTWVIMKFGITGKEAIRRAYAIRHVIAKKGTKPHPFLKFVFDQYRPKIANMIAEKLRTRLA